MNKVVPKLPKDIRLVILPFENYFEITRRSKDGKMLWYMQGKFPDDFPRAVLELVAKLYEATLGHLDGGPYDSRIKDR